LKEKNLDLIVALDIGSSKVSVAISELDDYGNIYIMGVGNVETKGGIRSGVIINLESVVNAINQAVEEAEIQAGREINGVFVGIAGTHIQTINSKGVVAISGSDKEIDENDINRVIEAAKAVAIPMDREVLHIIPQSFTVDGQKNIRYPIGMVGTRLECQIHMITTPISSIQNVVKCIDRCGLEIYDIVLQNLAASKSVLDDDEKEIGVLMIDIGAETSKTSIYYKGAPFYHSIYPLGGYLISNDIAAGLKVSLSTADKIKLVYGVTHFDYVNKKETIQIPSIGGRKPRLFARENLVHIVRPRVEEMLEIIKHDIKEKGHLDKIQGGIVLTGGTANIPGIVEVCQEVFDVQTREGIPKKIEGIDNKINSFEFTVINGLLRWGYERINKENNFMSKKIRDEGGKGFFKGLKNIFNEFF
jgi:cell division protein FtsA